MPEIEVKGKKLALDEDGFLQDWEEWDVQRFAELSDRMIEDFGVKIVLIWGPGEEDRVREIQGIMKQKPLIAPKTNIREMAELCKRSKMVICNEGGPLHIAASQGGKTISIFGPVDEKVYGAYPPGPNNVIIKSDVPCRPCYKGFRLPECRNRQCMEDISVQDVFRVVENTLRGVERLD